MGKFIHFLGFVLVMLILWLLLWPVPIKPVAWDAPVAPSYTGKWQANSDLAALNEIDLKGRSGPEDVTSRIIEGKTNLFASTHDGEILQIDPQSGSVSVFANTGGRPLGLEFDASDNLIVADAMLGLLSINPDAEITILGNTTENGSKILYADDLDIAADGRIFFSDASTRFSAALWKDTLRASILDLMEHSSNGRLLMYDPKTMLITLVQDGFNFANGVAMCPGDKCVFVAETGTYAVRRVWLEDNKGIQVDSVLENLPGFPDNINRSNDGTYWLGLTSPRVESIDKLSNKPFMRKVIMRLPDRFKPAPLPYGMVIQFGFDGHVLSQFQDPNGTYPTTTGAHDAGDGWLYISSLSAPVLARKGWTTASPAQAKTIKAETE